MRRLSTILFLLALCLQLPLRAQDILGSMGSGMGGFGGESEGFGMGSGQQRSTWGRDTSKVEKWVPTEFHQGRIDERLGTVIPEEYNDTLPHLFQNFDATEGLRGEYSILGNLGSPRLALNFLDRPIIDAFMFIQPF